MEAFVRWIAARIGVALTATVVLALIGAVSLLTLPVDAVPDVTNNQVQVVTAAPALAPAEVERTITLPVERAMAGTPGLKEVRSISKLGISVVTLIFRDDIDVYFARQQVGERLVDVRDRIPKGSGTPELGPIATGLGEIFMFVLEGPTFTPEELRTTMDWVIGPKLRQVKGVIETVHFGGELKQFRITLDPQKLAAHKVSLEEVRAALERDNQNAGGGTIEKSGEQLVLRAEARFRNLDEINDSVVKTQEGGVPLTLGMLGEIDTGPALRQGSMTMNGKGEVVAGFVLLLKGENSRDVVHRVKTEVDNVNKVLPKGMRVVPFLDRASFIERTVATVVRNLFEGAGVVVVVLLLTLGSLRAGLLVSGAIPFAMLVAFTGLRLTGMSANVMSLGAVDFGIVVEGAVVMVEGALHAAAHQGDRAKKRAAIVDACAVTARPVLVRGHHRAARVPAARHPRGRRGQDVPARGRLAGVHARRRAVLRPRAGAGLGPEPARQVRRPARAPARTPDAPVLRARPRPRRRAAQGHRRRRDVDHRRVHRARSAPRRGVPPAHLRGRLRARRPPPHQHRRGAGDGALAREGARAAPRGARG